MNEYNMYAVRTATKAVAQFEAEDDDQAEQIMTTLLNGGTVEGVAFKDMGNMCHQCAKAVGDLGDVDYGLEGTDAEGKWQEVLSPYTSPTTTALNEVTLNALAELVALKQLKDLEGKSPDYLRRVGPAWDAAFALCGERRA